MNTQEFSQKIKAKYPQYADVPDADLANKILAKYPQYASQIDVANSEKAPEKAPEKLGYVGRVKDAYKSAAKDIMSGIQKSSVDYNKNVQDLKRENKFIDELKAGANLARGGLRTAGGIARAVFAPITEAPVIKQVLEGVAGVVGAIPGVEGILRKGGELAKKYPEIAKDIQDFVDIAVVGKGSGVEKSIEKTVGETGATLRKNALSAGRKARIKFAKNLVMPVRTKKVKIAQVPRTVEHEKFFNLFKKDVVTPRRSEIESIKEVAKVSGIDPKATLQKNYNIIRDSVTQKAKDLKKQVSEKDFLIPRNQTMANLRRARDILEDSLLMVGDAQKAADKMLAYASKLVEQNKGSGSGILQARKQFDVWVKKQKPRIFDSATDNAWTKANEVIRDAFNEIFDRKALAAGVKGTAEKRASQSALLRALENLQVKAAEEADTVFGRTMQSIGRTLGTRNKFVQTLAAATGIGVFGAATAYAMPITVGSLTGFLIYKAGKFVMKPKVRETLGKLLERHAADISPIDRVAIEGFIQEFSEDAIAKQNANADATVNPIQNM